MPTILITGGHKGLGLACVEQLAAAGGFDLVLAGRDLAEVQAVAHHVQQAHGGNVRALLMDLSSLVSVRQGAAALKEMIGSGEVGPLQVLLNNAGAQFLSGVQYSVDGFEMTLATNFLGHFLLTNLLLDDIAPGGRIIFTASGTHDPDTMDGKMVGKAVTSDATALAGTGKKGKPISGGKRYATSKLCVLLFGYELDRRLRKANASVASIAFDPGLMMETGLGRSAPPLAQRLSRTAFASWLFKSLGVTMGSASFSGASLAQIAIAPQFADASGKYLQSHNGMLLEAQSSTASHDLALAAKLWRDADTLTRLQPTERPERLAFLTSRCGHRHAPPPATV